MAHEAELLTTKGFIKGFVRGFVKSLLSSSSIINAPGHPLWDHPLWEMVPPEKTKKTKKNYAKTK